MHFTCYLIILVCKTQQTSTSGGEKPTHMVATRVKLDHAVQGLNHDQGTTTYHNCFQNGRLDGSAHEGLRVDFLETHLGQIWGVPPGSFCWALMCRATLMLF